MKLTNFKSMDNARDNYWRKFIKKHSYSQSWKLQNAIDDFYKRNDDKVFKGLDGFIFIKNEVFGSSDKLFTDLFNSTYHLLTK